MSCPAIETKQSQNIHKQSRKRPNATNIQLKLSMWLTLRCKQNIVVNPCVWKYLIYRKWRVAKAYNKWHQRSTALSCCFVVFGWMLKEWQVWIIMVSNSFQFRNNAEISGFCIGDKNIIKLKKSRETTTISMGKQLVVNDT